MSDKKYRISECFASFQGEGLYSGQLTIFVRFFGCNLDCEFFGQPHGTDIEKRETWLRPYKTIDLSSVKTLEDLPVFTVGCDSSYSWSARFKHLAKNLTANEIASEVVSLAENHYGVDLVEEWNKPNRACSSQLQICFTGGEPMLQQSAITEICRALIYERGVGVIPRITIETNATIFRKDLHIRGKVAETHISMSPKLFYVSGERDKVNLEVISQYVEYADTSAIKFVLNNDPMAWDELDFYLPALRKMIKDYHNCSLFVMPCGSTAEDLSPEHIEPIVRKAMKRNLHISLRGQAYCFGNKIGT